MKNPPECPPWSAYSEGQRWGFLGLLLGAATLSVVDRVIISVLLDPIKREFHLSDTVLGLMSGFAFALCYAAAGIVFARWADRGNRRTVIAVALVSWSAMTVLCGLAQSRWQLMLARMGVGVAESGSGPPTQSLIADYFPPARRATAIAFLNATGNLGYLIGIGVGGSVAALHGWRAAFMCVGAPGILLAVVVNVALAEPRLRSGFVARNERIESLGASLARLRNKPSYLYALGGISLYSICGYGLSLFMPSYQIRVLHSSLSQVSVTFGIALSASTAVGALLGGWCSDRLSQRDIRWNGWLPAAGCAIAVPIYWIALSASDFWDFLWTFCAAEVFLAAGFPAVYAGIHAVCGNRRRATAFAAVYLVATLVGLGLGPLAVGAMSDALSPAYPVDSLRYSLMSMLLALAIAAAAFGLFARALPHDLDGVINDE